MKTPPQFAITGLFALFLLIGTTAGSLLHAEPQYFWATSNNGETGAALGVSTNESSLPTWAALYSQFSGEILEERLRLASTAGANWTFLWMRAANDTHSYKMTPIFTVEKGFSGHVAIRLASMACSITPKSPGRRAIGSRTKANLIRLSPPVP